LKPSHSWPNILRKAEKIFGQWGRRSIAKPWRRFLRIVVDAEPKSISHNHTFGEDTDDLPTLHPAQPLSQKTCKRLREAGLPPARSLSPSLRRIRYIHSLAHHADQYIRHGHLSAPFFALGRASHKTKIRLLRTALIIFTHGGEQLIS